jgi:hypothetical protein
VNVALRSDKAVVSVDGVVAVKAPLPTPQRRWLLLRVPSTDPPLAVAVVRYPNRHYRVAAFIDEVNVDDGSKLADWGEQRFAPMDRFEDNFVDSGVNKLPAAMLYGVVLFYASVARESTTPVTIVVGFALAVGAASWVLFCGRVVTPYLASQQSWPVAGRNLTWGAVFGGGLMAFILAALALRAV